MSVSNVLMAVSLVVALVLIGVLGYCILWTIRNVRRKHYGWALGTGLIALLLLVALAMPFETHVIKIDLPSSR